MSQAGGNSEECFRPYPAEEAIPAADRFRRQAQRRVELLPERK